jgi:UDP-N-acetylmuramoyl-tripeptide--D-alanyl-D-alanine ligase
VLTAQWVATTLDKRLHRRQSIGVTGFSIDSRSIRHGQFFIALPGARVDGHDFLEQAYDQGASGALVSKDDLESKRKYHNLVVVENTQQSMFQMAKAYRQLFQMPLIGITGSVGKTTTKELLGRLLQTRFKAYVSPGNYNNEIGLPISILNMPFGIDAGVFEVGTQKPGELKPLAYLLGPSISVITSITDAHRGYFENEMALVKEKWSMVDASPLAGGIVALNADHSALWARATNQRFRLDFGIDNKAAMFRAEEIEDFGLDGMAFTLAYPAGRIPMRTPLLGKHNLYNVLAAIAVAVEMRIPPQSIQDIVSKVGAYPHRMERKASPFGTILDDSYNASPTAVKEALNTLSQIDSKSNKIFVFGDMRELGHDEINMHKQVADWLQDSDIRHVFTVGDLAAETVRELQKHYGWTAEKAHAANSVDEVENLLRHALKDDNNLILVKGSRAMALERLVDHLGEANPIFEPSEE